MVANAESRFIMMDVMRELQRRHGSRLHLYCNTAQALSFYRAHNRDGAFETIATSESLLENAVLPVENEQEEIALAQRFEAQLGRSFNSLAVANRHLGRGYALGGFRHPRSRLSEESDYIMMLRGYNRVFQFWENEFRQKNITIMLGGPAEAICAARMNGLPTRCIAGSRHANLHYWAHNEFNDNPALNDTIPKSRREASDEAEMRQAYKLVGTMDKKHRRQNSLIGMMYQFSKHVARHVYWRVRGYEKAKAYFVSDLLRMIVRRWRDSRRMSSPRLARLDDLANTPFVFFPLATEPEASLQQFSPEFFFQHATIAALSRDLPAGVRLVVKETIMGVGRRPDNFYDQIAELKNVVWMNMLEPGLEVARRANAVAVISGTSGFEAAVMGRPVISFGMHNPYNVLPHVFHVTDLARTGDAVRQIFKNDIDPHAAKRAGARYLQAVIDTSFDLGDYDYVNLKNYDESVVARACDALEWSLDFDKDAVEPVTTAG